MDLNNLPINSILNTIIESPTFQFLYQQFYHTNFIYFRDALFLLLLTKYSFYFLETFYRRGPKYFFESINYTIRKLLYKLILNTPLIKDKVQQEIQKNITKVGESGEVVPSGLKWYKQLPSKGFNETELINLINDYGQLGDQSWQKNQTSGAIYRNQDQDDELPLKEVIKVFGLSNTLHPELFPGINKMEREIVGMVLNMFNAPKGASGSFTLGGTESILMACKAYRDYSKEVKGIDQPNMIVPVTIHAAFNKASEYFGIELIYVDVDEQFKIKVDQVKRLINSNTILIAGSCINYPNGAMDDIKALSDLALKYNVGLHVDCCLGGFIVPFMEEAGYPLETFDFRLPGVTSISCDTHKYGCTIKGSSVVLYRTQELLSYQFSVYPEWTGGIYATPSIQGSKPGLLVAACWVGLMARGRSYYVEQAKHIVTTVREIVKGCQDLPCIEVMGDPKVSVVGFKSKIEGFSPFPVADAMQRRGWTLNKIQHPNGFHIAVTSRHIGKAKQFVDDLKTSIKEVQEHPNQFNSSVNQLYGSKAKLKGTDISVKVIRAYLLGWHKTD